MPEHTLTISAQPLTLRHISKQYDRVPIIHDISLNIGRGELVCLLGPSGCGKTTLLRIIAGLEQQESGNIWLGQRDISHVHPSLRNYGILFQSYALFPNLTVAQNVAYSLSAKAMLRVQVRERVTEMLELVGLSHLAKKYPSQISGGQQQRVALARALAPSPALLLLDEPMSALDARVRERLRYELRQLLKRLGITTVMVTHDQEEAMIMADRIAVINKGRIEQFDTPEVIYNAPATANVADFIGQANWLYPSTPHPFSAVPDGCHLFWRPEAVSVMRQSENPAHFPATIQDTLFLGNRLRLNLKVNDYPDILMIADIPVNSSCDFQSGQHVWLHISENAIRYFEDEGK
ncbi:ATP-binding cassette domain-containing protein [Salmonella enterica subsp. enterica]|nr:ATP-binding cassette domain-containing protein [Salmonella enterica]EBY0806487.1 ATP-binding cassette domain-containing protein [Salmonella enterica subsp. enterica serovar Berlin]ECF3780254.1 ATP-binding cassette domain-containing protein [Salmonella enterica subsp. enterica serovar Oslo]EDR2105139.1 ATP-binding cassette domain-containing protein [Salmonella enterica subsp. enterica]EDW0613059.1 ATP-binding cassette domain-containing protein [Salmonella enterica subsp. enterica serovar Ball